MDLLQSLKRFFSGGGGVNSLFVDTEVVQPTSDLSAKIQERSTN